MKRLDCNSRIAGSNPVEVFYYYAKRGRLTCPYCKSNRELYTDKNQHGHSYTTKGYQNIIKELVGDEYSLIGKYPGIKHRVPIRHTVCGEIQEYYAFDFIRGRRCRKCSPALTRDYVISSVRDLSNGKYEARADDKKGYFIVKNTSTEVEKRMTNILLMQELLRPTPSTALP